MLAMQQEQPGRVGRRLAAIVAADVAGYSRLMGLDEVGTARTLREHRKVTDALVAKHGGRIVKTTGDGVLLEFPSVVDAVECAVAVQAVMAERNEGIPQDRRMLYRIGINLGDILIEGDDILGDGVNIAARLEGIAEAGGICISSSAYEQVRGRVVVEFADLGEQRLKNIDRPVRAYAAKSKVHPGAVAPSVSPLHPEERRQLPLPDKPSIAVLPFQNMSGDPEQDYFADGMVEEIITALSRFKSLFVIARNSSFTYKGKAVDIKQVGRELGVRYVLEGSVRKSAGKVRITGQLIDSTTGAHVWADRFDGELKDVFELQDQITTSVVGELITNVQVAEIERANRKPTTSLDAYDCYWKGLAEYWKNSKSSSDAALSYFLKAIDLDQNFASAYGFAAVVYAVRWQNRWMIDVAEERAEAVRLARRAIELGQSDEMSLCRGGFVIAALAGELDFGAECARRGLAMNPNYAIGWLHSAWIQLYSGEHQTVREHARQLERLSPRDPRLFQGKTAAAFSHLFEGHYEEAAYLAEQLTHELPAFGSAWRILAISRTLAGDVASANIATRKVLELDPSATVSAMASSMPLRRVADVERLKEGYLRAGFPP
jgi:TolB-like protein/class 3 adenylate cyclase